MKNLAGIVAMLVVFTGTTTAADDHGKPFTNYFFNTNIYYSISQVLMHYISFVIMCICLYILLSYFLCKISLPLCHVVLEVWIVGSQYVQD